MELIQNVTSADIQRYVRIVIYTIVGALGQRGISVDGSWIELAISVVGFGATLAWSVYGMRIKAKIAEMSALAENKATPVAAVIMTNSVEGRRLADTTPGPVVTAGSSQARQLAA
jgi:hypothetical protein